MSRTRWIRSSRSFLLIAIMQTLISCGGGGSSSSSNGSSAGTSSSTNSSAGSASPWLLDQSPGLLKFSSPGHNSDQFFGQAVAVSDFNDDGEADLAVGAPLSDTATTITNPTNTGGVYIYYSVNHKVDDSGVADVFLNPGTDLNNQYGVALLADDVNNDGVDDLLVGAHFDDRLGATTGGVYFYHGSTTGISQAPDSILNHPLLQVNASFGSSLHRTDLNGDNLPELLVGAERDDTQRPDGGAIWISRARLITFIHPLQLQ